MQIDTRRLYFNAVVGGLGGLFGWALVALVLQFPTDRAWLLYLRDALMGLGVGACIGGAIGATDGLVTNRSRHRALLGARYGAALGAVGGFIGLPLGELMLGLAGGGTWPRALGWAIFGMFVGASDGFAQKMPSKLRYGLLGGLLGGLVGGSTYERLSVGLLGVSGNRPLAIALGSAVGLVILGACIGALVGLVESLLRRAWLTFLSGRDEGQSRTLDPQQPTTSLGRSDRCGIVLTGDPGVSDIHALITMHEGQFVLEPNGGAVLLQNAGAAGPVVRHVLHDGDQVQLGSTRFVFHAEEVPAP